MPHSYTSAHLSPSKPFQVRLYVRSRKSLREAHSMNTNIDLIAKLRIQGLSADRSLRSELKSSIRQSKAALEQAERELTELGTAFRDYKIVHPEGTR